MSEEPTECCYPYCGCDGARQCYFGEANELAMENNTEGKAGYIGELPEPPKESK